jgi:hypothetical protein
MAHRAAEELEGENFSGGNASNINAPGDRI